MTSSKQISIVCGVDATDAARDGVTEYGQIAVRPTAEQWAAATAADLAEVARSEAFAAAIRLLASHEEDLARASADGYDVTSAVLDRLAARVQSNAKASADTSLWTTSLWTNAEERSAPRPEAFALLDRVTAAVKAANETLPVAIGRWLVSRIVRVDVCPHDRKRHNVTAVLATLETASGDREVTFSTEPLACSHEDPNY